MTVLFFFSIKKQEAEIEEKLDTFYLKKKNKKMKITYLYSLWKKLQWMKWKLEGFNISIFNFYILFFV